MRKHTSILRHLHAPAFRKGINLVIKSLIVGLLAWVLYRQRVAGQDVPGMYRHFVAELQTANAGWLWLAVLLMPANWLLESLKWQVFTRTFTQLSVWQHLRAVLAGVTFSLFTPNRLGDYLGRLLVISEGRKGQVLVATLAAGYVQLIVLLILGWLGALYFLPTFTDLAWSTLAPFVFVGVGGTILLIILLLWVEQLLLFVKKWPRIQRMAWVRHSINVARSYERRQIAEALGWAGLRYGIYSVQYYCILQCIGLELAAAPAFAGIATVFLLQTSVPLPPALGLLARGEIALFVWGVFGANDLSVLTASYGLFLLNLLLPGLWGLTTVIRTNLLKPTDNENQSVLLRSDSLDVDVADGTDGA